MSLLSWADDRSGAMTVWDLGFMKVTSMLFGIIVGAYLASFVIENILWFLVPMLVLGARSGYRWLVGAPKP